MKNLGTILLSLVVLLLLLSLSTYTVDERQYALVFRLGKIVAVKEEAGLYFKVPLADNVRYFDKRILTLSWEEADRFLTSEKKNVLVDSFVKWRIIDPVKYYVSVKGDEQQAERRLSQTVNDGLRAEFGKRTVQDVISGERSEIMEILRQRADRDSRQIGFGELPARHWYKPPITPEVDHLLDAIAAVDRQRRQDQEINDQNDPVEAVELVERTDVAPGFIDSVVEVPFEDRLRVVADRVGPGSWCRCLENHE